MSNYIKFECISENSNDATGTNTNKFLNSNNQSIVSKDITKKSNSNSVYFSNGTFYSSEMRESNLALESKQDEFDTKSLLSTKRGSLQLWQFLLNLLCSKKNEKIIEWTRKSSAEFKLLDPEEVARQWGVQKNRPTMNYDKLSRSLRYYYEKGIMQKVSGERYVYRFINHRELYLLNPELVDLNKVTIDLNSPPSSQLINSCNLNIKTSVSKMNSKKISINGTNKLKKTNKLKTQDNNSPNYNSTQRYSPYQRQYSNVTNQSQYINSYSSLPNQNMNQSLQSIKLEESSSSLYSTKHSNDSSPSSSCSSRLSSHYTAPFSSWTNSPKHDSSTSSLLLTTSNNMSYLASTPNNATYQNYYNQSNGSSNSYITYDSYDSYNNNNYYSYYQTSNNNNSFDSSQHRQQYASSPLSATSKSSNNESINQTKNKLYYNNYYYNQQLSYNDSYDLGNQNCNNNNNQASNNYFYPTDYSSKFSQANNYFNNNNNSSSIVDSSSSSSSSSTSSDLSSSTNYY